MTLARQRADLIDEYSIPVLHEDGSCTYETLPEWLPCAQPEVLNYAEFNVIIERGDQLIKASSIDLEFKTE